MFLKSIIAIFVIAVAGFVLAKSCRAGDPPAAGAAAPDFQLNAQDGKPVGPKDYRGHWVVLYFYPKDFTSGCTIEAHNFQKDIGQYKALDAIIIGISVDSTGSHKDFCAKEGLNFKLLSDDKHEVSALYGSLHSVGPVGIAARNTFIIDPAGNIAKTFIGVKPATHSAEVLAALQELQKK
jgi:peroxiredoxin Q/BCP